MDNNEEKREYQTALIAETAQRLAADGNKNAASCLYNMAAAVTIGYEEVLANKLCKEMTHVIHSDL